MLPVILAALRTYAPYVTFPAALIIGFVGYNIEGLLSNKQTPNKKISIQEQRDLRLLEENVTKDATDVDSIKLKKFVPKTIFGRNVSPSLKDMVDE
ncbi:Uncharacterised protein g10199 [Pycnogonum litorale]